MYKTTIIYFKNIIFFTCENITNTFSRYRISHQRRNKCVTVSNKKINCISDTYVKT